VHIINPRRKLIQKAEFVMEKDKNKNLSVEDIYTPLSVAKKELLRRRKDKKLKKKVDDFLGKSIPNFLKGKPRALLVRQITSPDIEFFQFLDLIKLISLKPLFVEFKEDKFTSCNPDKYYRCKLVFFNGKGKNGGNKIHSKKIADIDLFDGKKIKQVKTIWKNSLLDFHHNLIKKACPSATHNIVDVSNWVKKNGKTADKFYLKYLTWFVYHGILFENFAIKDKDSAFTKKIVLPSIKKIEKEFGLKPLIVPVVPVEDQDDNFWWYYSEKIEKMIPIALKK